MMNNRKLRVLCLDIEGGNGGSSRSLFNSLINLPRDEVDIVVWCRRSGVIQDYYRAFGIPVEITPGMPKITSLPRLSRNLLLLGLFIIRDWPRSYEFRNKLLKEGRNFDVIHCNLEALYWLARWINKHVGVAVTMHKRTNLWPSIFASFQMRVISRYVSGVIFITENEEMNFTKLGGHGVDRRVIYNIVSTVEELPLPLERIPNDDRFKVCTLANYSYLRGIDLLIDVALNLRVMGHTEILFVVAGDLTLSRSLPGKLGEVAQQGGDLSDYACEMGVEKMFLFLGHVKEPERVLSGCQVLIRPSREYNPWGRDVLEALSLGRPVIAAGTYHKFVENEITGVLLDEFDPHQVAEKIIVLSKDRDLVESIGRQGKKRVELLCNGTDRARDLLQFWQQVVYG